MQRDNEASYVEIMKDSLVKKIAVLEKISGQNKIQQELAKAEEFDYDVFGKTLEEKDKLIDEINRLDSGFQSIFDRVKEILESGREKYADDIKEMQRLISVITDKSADVMAEEKRNREAIMNRKDSLKKEVGVARATNKVAANYYKTMSKLNVLDSQFIDAKK